MGKRGQVFDVPRELIYCVYCLALFGCNLRDTLFNMSADNSGKWRTELVFLNFFFFIHLIISYSHVVAKSIITLFILQLSSVLLVAFNILYDIFLTHETFGLANTTPHQTIQLIYEPFAALGRVSLVIYLLCSLILRAEYKGEQFYGVEAFIEVILILINFIRKKFLSKGKEVKDWTIEMLFNLGSGEKTEFISPFYITLDRGAIFFLFVLTMMGNDLSTAFVNGKQANYNFRKYETIARVIYFIVVSVFLLIPVSIYCALRDIISLMVVQVISVLIFIFMVIYDTILCHEQFPGGHKLTYNIRAFYTGFNYVDMTSHYGFPLYMGTFLLLSFMLRTERMFGVKKNQRAYSLEGFVLTGIYIFKVVKNIIQKKKNRKKEKEESQQQQQQQQQQSSDENFKIEDMELMAFERGAVFFFIIICMIACLISSIQLNMFLHFSRKYSDTETVMVFFYFIILIISFVNMCLRDFVSLIILQLGCTLLFFIHMIADMILIHKINGTTVFHYASFAFAPFMSTVRYVYMVPLLLCCYLVKVEHWAVKRRSQYYLLESFFGLGLIIYQKIKNRKKILALKADELKDDYNRIMEQLSDQEDDDATLVVLDYGMIYYLIILFLFAMSFGVIIRDELSGTNVKKEDVNMSLSAAVYFFYLLVIWIHLNLRDAFSLMILQIIAFVLFWIRFFYDFSLYNENPNSGSLPNYLAMGIVYAAVGTGSFQTMYAIVLLLTAFLLKTDRGLGFERKKSYYAVEGVVVMIKWGISKVLKKKGKSESKKEEDQEMKSES